MVDNQLEESVHQQDSIWQDTAAVQENGLRRTDTSSLEQTPNTSTVTNSAPLTLIVVEGVEGVRLTSGGP